MVFIRCTYCGSDRIVIDRGSIICTNCATVIDYESVPSIRDIIEKDPREYTTIDFRREAAKIILYRMIEKRIIVHGKKRAEVYEYIARLYSGDVERIYNAAWKVYRRAVEALGSDVTKKYMDIRDQMVMRNIKEAAKMVGIEEEAENIYQFALKHRNLWSGRRSHVVAYVFTLLYCMHKNNKACLERSEIFPRRVVSLANMLFKAIQS